MQTTPPSTIDAYLENFPTDIRQLLEAMRQTIREAAPGATECINYGIPTFQLHGNLVHFAAFKNHIGFYPGPSGIEAFKDELSLYKGAKGSVQFPLEQPLPLSLLRKIVLFRVEENITLAAAKKRKQA